MRVLALFAVLASLTLTGCDLFVGINEELKAGEKELERYGGPADGSKKGGSAASAPTETAASGNSGASEAMRKAAERWWGNAKSLIPSEKKDPTVVRCELGGGVQFMREVDCQMRGGRASRS